MDLVFSIRPASITKGANKGVFLQLTAEEPEDAQVPGRPYTFGLLKKAQAMGDLEALENMIVAQ